MSKSMWADDLGYAVFLSQVLNNQENHLSGEASSSAIEEYRVCEFGFGRDVYPCAFNILEEDFQAAVADGHKPFLAAFAENAQEAVFLIYVADLQSDEF